MFANEKVAFLKGLLEGMSSDIEQSKEGKIYAAMVDVLESLAEEMEEMAIEVDTLANVVDELDEDLGAAEEFLYDDEDEDDDDDWDGFYNIACPACQEEFSVDETTLLEESIECPNCGEKLEFELDCDCGCEDDCDDDCDCGCKG